MRPIDIKQRRQRLGLTQTQFALALGCKKGTIENYEQAKRKPSEVFDTLQASMLIDTIHQFAAEYGINLFEEEF